MDGLEYGHKSRGTKMQSAERPKLAPCDYTLVKSLGKGVFGEVFLATDIDGIPVALKRISKDHPRFNLKLVKREIEAGQRLPPNDGIVSLKSYFETVANVYLVFDFVDGGDLFSFMEQRDFRPLEEKRAKRIFAQIAAALLHCHRHGVAHRDVKLDNVLIDKNGDPKLIDFGLASMDEPVCTTFVGSPEYVAPEIVKNQPYSGHKADVYSLGISLYCAIFGQFPFIPEQRFQMLREGNDHPPIEWPDATPRFPHVISKSLKDLLSRMLAVEPEARISMEEVLHHRWFLEDKDAVAGAASLEAKPMVSLREINVC